MADKKSYTAGEWLTLMAVTPMVSALIMLISLPLGLITAWVRVVLWGWFIIPYFHLPHLSVWQMFAIGIFLSSFHTTQELKPEFYPTGVWARIGLYYAGQFLSLGVGYLIHITVLKG